MISSKLIYNFGDKDTMGMQDYIQLTLAKRLCVVHIQLFCFCKKSTFMLSILLHKKMYIKFM